MPRKGYKQTLEHSERIRLAITGKKRTAGTIAKISGANNHRFGKPGTLLGKNHTEASRAKMSAAKIGTTLTAEHRAAIGAGGMGRRTSAESLLKVSGENHWNWKGGITDENHAVRASGDYVRWRRAVFARDDHTCQQCGARGVFLHAHHVKGFSDHPTLRFDVDNGLTVCVECHKDIHWPDRPTHQSEGIYLYAYS